MPRSRQGIKRPPVNVDDLKHAVDDVLSKRFSIREAAKNHAISKTTLLRHLKAHQASSEDSFCYKSNIKTHQVFTDVEEGMLQEYLLMASKLHYGLSKRGLAVLAHQFAMENKKKVPIKWSEEKMAGKEWVRGFLRRHSILRLRKPEATSLSRASSFNRTNVAEFFTNLKNCLERFKFSPNRIYNLDETGNSTVHVPPKILAEKGQKQIGTMTSGERGVNITMIAAINAVGNHIPPMLIFPRVHFKDHMMKGAPPGSIGGANPSGWSNENLFVQYLQHFIAHVKPTVEEKVLLIFDNHETHISVAAINLAKHNGIVLLTLPPHSSHKLQPLDRTVFGPYKTFYNQAANEWMVNNPGKTISIYDVAEIIGKAYSKSFTIANIVKGFQVTGICPLNESIFGDDEFLGAYVTDRVLETENNKLVTEEGQHNQTTEGTTGDLGAGTSQIVSPENIRPFPKAPARKKQINNRRKGKTRVLTDTPIKDEIEQSKGKKSIKPPLVEKVKKKVLIESSSSDSEDESLILEDSSSGDEETFLLELRNEEEEHKKINSKESLAKGDFILVRIGGEKSFSHFVAEIDKVCNGGFIVKYYSKIPGTTAARNFIPSSEEKSFIQSDEIILQLPFPNTVGTSRRQAAQICFDIDFSEFKMM